MDGLATEDISVLLRWLEDGPAGTIPIESTDRSLGRLQAVTWQDAADREAMGRLGRWHEILRGFLGFAAPTGNCWLATNSPAIYNRIIILPRRSSLGQIAARRIDNLIEIVEMTTPNWSRDGN